MLTIKKKKDIIKYLIYYAGALVLGLYFLFPFFATVTRALMPMEDLGVYPIPIVPSRLAFENFMMPFTMEENISVDYLKSILNSLYVTIIKTIGVVISSFLCSFALSRIKFRGRKILFSVGMMTIMLPGIVTMIPLFIVYRNLGFLGTLLPLWVPALFGGGMMSIFLEMQFIKSVPKTMDEAAIIDGANWLQIAFLITLPLVTPVLTYVAITTVIASWNDFMGPLVYISNDNPEKFTLPLAFWSQFKTGGSAQTAMVNVKAALGIIMMIPILTIFACFKDKIIHGVSLGGGIKG